MKKNATISNKNRGQHKLTQKRHPEGQMKNDKNYNQIKQQYTSIATNRNENRWKITKNKPFGCCIGSSNGTGLQNQKF